MTNGSTVTNYREGDIATAIIYDSSVNARSLASLAGEVWFGLEEDLAKYTGSPIYLNAENEEVKKILAKITVNEKDIPVIAFLRYKGSGDFELKQKLSGNVSREAIWATYFREIYKIYGTGDHALATHKSKYQGYIQGDGQGIPFLTKEAKNFLLIALTALATYQASKAENGAGKIAYGGLAAFTGYQLLPQNTETIRL